MGLPSATFSVRKPKSAAATNLLKNAIVAFFNLAKCGAKPRTARKIATYRHFAITSV